MKETETEVKAIISEMQTIAATFTAVDLAACDRLQDLAVQLWGLLDAMPGVYPIPTRK